jgi:hypothetical protein
MSFSRDFIGKIKKKTVLEVWDIFVKGVSMDRAF